MYYKSAKIQKKETMEVWGGARAFEDLTFER
jgi:hypothetical protein